MSDRAIGAPVDPVGCGECGQLYGPGAIGAPCSTAGCQGTIKRHRAGKVLEAHKAALVRMAHH